MRLRFCREESIGIRVQKRNRIFKGLRVDLSKTGSSWTVGGIGASVNLACEKFTGKVGIPGIGGMDLPSPPQLFALYALA